MIPKIIHFCWMSGDAYPEDINRCLQSWKNILPDYEIRLWNSQTFDMNKSIWVKEAYEKKKYAFCADYIRLYALYNYGGIYLDSDVEVLKSYNNLLDLPYFIGLESKGIIEAATMGAEKGNPFIADMLKYYKNRHFVKGNGELDLMIMPEVMRRVLDDKYRMKIIKDIKDFEYSSDTISVFPSDWFSPIDTSGKRYVLKTTTNTYSIHRFASAWVDPKVMLLVKIFGYNSKTRFFIQSVAKRIKTLIKHVFL